MLYLDASALVCLYAAEPKSALVNERLAKTSDLITASSWTLLECVSAFALKSRFGSISAADAMALGTQLQADAGRDFAVEHVLDQDAIDGAALIRSCPTPLRSGDALHLAVCRRLGARLLSLDGEMLTAASALVIAVETV